MENDYIIYRHGVHEVLLRNKIEGQNWQPHVIKTIYGDYEQVCSLDRKSFLMPTFIEGKEYLLEHFKNPIFYVKTYEYETNSI